MLHVEQGHDADMNEFDLVLPTAVDEMVALAKDHGRAIYFSVEDIPSAV